jgi:hypothetical protein
MKRVGNAGLGHSLLSAGAGALASYAGYLVQHSADDRHEVDV